MPRMGTAAAACLALAVTTACSEPTPFEPTTAASRSSSALTPAGVAGTDFTASDIPVALLDPGKAVLADGRIVIHGLTAQSVITASDPRVSGTAVVTANGVLAATDGSGPVWGDFTIDAGVGGTWVGTWHGQRRMTGETWTAVLDLRMRGHGGAVDKLQASGTNTITSFALVPTAYVGAMAGTIW